MLFVGKVGQLNNMIRAMGVKREEVYIANVVKCRPPANPRAGAELGLKAGARGSFPFWGGVPPSPMYPGPNGFRFIGLATMAFGKIIIVEGLRLK